MLSKIENQDDVQGLLVIFSETWGAETLSEFVSSIENSICLLSKDENRVTGYLFYGFDMRGNFMEITDIGVEKSSRGKGYGKELVTHIQSLCDSVKLCVKTDNTVAKSLYESLGFKVTLVIQNYYGVGHDGYRMEWNKNR
jgi:ribosomal protein S18 acetylase RimI-like enzyme